MGLGIVFGVIAFLVVGAITSHLTSSSGLFPAFLAGIAGVAWGVHVTNENRKITDNPPQYISSLTPEQAFLAIRELIINSYFGTNWWTIRSENVAGGSIDASLSFTEDYGQSVGVLMRQVVLHVNIGSTPEGWASVRLKWHVMSPVNSSKCDEIISALTQAIRASITAR